jgi:Lrp/AsnC family transcriptional regulator for asnA, asnC and gidA
MMGYKAICNTAINLNQNEEDQVIAYIKKLPFKTAFIEKSPQNCITLVASFAEINEVSKFKESVKQNKYVQDVKVEVWTDAKFIPEKLEISNQDMSRRSFEFVTEVHKGDCRLDRIDHQLIDILLKDSMQPFDKIAKDIGTSINAISRRLKRLTENGVIKPVVQLNLPKLGYYALAIFPIVFGPEIDQNEIIKNIFTIKDSFFVIKTTGNFDLFAFVVLRDLNQLLETQDKINNIRAR